MKLPYRTVFLVVSLLAGASSRARAEPVITLGDDLLTNGTDELATALAAANLRFAVQNFASARATAELYAVQLPNALSSVIEAETDAEVVYVSLGLNDFIQLNSAGLGSQAAVQIGEHLNAVFDRLVVSSPGVQFLLTGYPFTNFTRNPSCQGQAEMIFGANWSQAGINRAVQTAIDDNLAALAARHPAVTFVPVADALQRATGVPADPSMPSPATFMLDCILPNAAGHRAMMEDVVDGYWRSFRIPSVAIAAPLPVCAGANVELTATSSGATRLLWRIDSSPQTEVSTTLRFTAPSRPGPTPVSITAFNGPWQRTDTTTVSIRACPDAGIADAEIVADTGVSPPDTGIDAGSVEPPDAGTAEPDGPELQIESGCRSTDGPAGFAGVGLVLAGGYLLRRRRKVTRAR